jgi:hypothetical protein
MANFIQIEPTKTYASVENAHKAVEKKYPTENSVLRYTIMTHTDGRFFPVFIGINALQHGVHFNGFNIIA